MMVVQRDGRPHIALVADAINIVDRSICDNLSDLYREIESASRTRVIDVSFDLTDEEYRSLVSIGNKLRGNMDRLTEYRWDFIMTMLYEDLFVGEDGKDRVP